MSDSLYQSQSAAAVYFQSVYDAFLKATSATECISFSYNIGGRVVEQQFAGTALIDVMRPAIAHMSLEPESTTVPPTSLTVCIWDSQSTGVPLPSPTWTADAYGPAGEIAGYNNERYRIVHQPGLAVMSLIDLQENLAIYWTRSAAHIPYWKRSFPVRTILHWWTHEQPLQLIHSGAVGLAKGGVLIVGKSGSGKSTTTLACLESPLLFAGDDYMLIDLTSAPHVHSLYNTAKLTADNIFRFPQLRHAISNTDRLDEEKALMFLYEHYPEKITKGFPLRGIFIPCVTGATDTCIKPIRSMLSLQAIAPTTLLHLPGFGQEALQKMSRLVEQLPSYSLELGTDLTQIPSAIMRFLDNYGQ